MTVPVVLLVLCVALLAAVLAIVPHGHRAVVLRAGTVRRVAGAGVVWRLPLAERAVRVASQPQELPVRTRATTVDGVPVLVSAETEVRLLPPPVGDRWSDPCPDVERIGEQVLAGLVATLPVAELRYALRAAEHALRDRLAEELPPHRVEVLAVTVLEVELPLASGR